MSKTALKYDNTIDFCRGSNEWSGINQAHCPEFIDEMVNEICDIVQIRSFCAWKLGLVNSILVITTEDTMNISSSHKIEDYRLIEALADRMGWRLIEDERDRDWWEEFNKEQFGEQQSRVDWDELLGY